MFDPFSWDEYDNESAIASSVNSKQICRSVSSEYAEDSVLIFIVAGVAVSKVCLFLLYRKAFQMGVDLSEF